ncbi:hypothetical protein PG985_005555 [Apiospora marii]|uniref:uncharacterized protein n=1 Tax=Apiospora marii TaxID=335849 RepID=UPI00312DCFA9
MPRKHRIYGSIESLDRRYRAINALTQNLHPQLGAEPTAEEVIAYGRDMGLEIPDNFDDTSSIPATSTQTITRKRPRSVSTAALLSPVSPDTKTARPSDRRSSDESEKLVRNPSERPQYISPTGSMVFYTRLRNLVVTRSKSASSTLGGDPHSLAEENDMITDPIVVYEGHPANAQPLSPSMFRGDSPTTSFSSHDVAQANKSELLRHCVPSSKVKFPEREVADRYIEAFFQHIHPNFVLFHRPTFQHVYEEIWRAATATTTEPGRGAEQSAGADSDTKQSYLSGG